MICRHIHFPYNAVNIVPSHIGLIWFGHQIKFYNIFPLPSWREDLCSSISPPQLWCSFRCHTHGNVWHRANLLCSSLCQRSVLSVAHVSPAQSHQYIGTDIFYRSNNKLHCLTCMWCVVWYGRLWTFVWCWWWCWIYHTLRTSRLLRRKPYVSPNVL